MKTNTEFIYLTSQRIDKLLDLELPEYLTTARDWLIISCLLGLRKKDLFNLTPKRLQNDRFKVMYEGRFKRECYIPIHDHIKVILERRGGNLPPVMNHSIYNKNIKRVCKEAGFCELMLGVKKIATVDSKTRQVTKHLEQGYYPFYEWVTSTIGCWSFGINNQNQLPPYVVEQLMGWNHLGNPKLTVAI